MFFSVSILVLGWVFFTLGFLRFRIGQGWVVMSGVKMMMDPQSKISTIPVLDGLNVEIQSPKNTRGSTIEA